MTYPSDSRRESAAAEKVAGFRTEPQPDGSMVLVLLTVGDQPYTLIEDRLFMDRHLTRWLLHALTRDLDGILDPGPRPEAVALIDAFRSGDRAAITKAMDAENARILNLWADRSEPA